MRCEKHKVEVPDGQQCNDCISGTPAIEPELAPAPKPEPEPEPEKE